MNPNTESTLSVADIVMIIIATLIIVAAVASFYIYAEYSQLLRIVGLLGALAVAAGFLLPTAPGRTFRGFVHNARNEVRKVVWPTREETVQTTRLVIITVVVAALFFWCLDWILGKLIRSVIGG